MMRAIVAALAMGILWPAPIVHADYFHLTSTLPACEEEDGNVDGMPCWWTDSTTGNGYYVTSQNYRGGD